MNYFFSIAVMSNMLAMTAMLIILSLAGKSDLAADIGVCQAATSAILYAFSANARNMILATSTATLSRSIFNIRLILLAPLVALAFWLSVTLGGVGIILSGILILRRTVEWLSEVDLSEKERVNDKKFAIKYVLTQTFLFFFAVIWLLLEMPQPLLGMFFWAFLPLSLSVNFFWSALKDFIKVTTKFNKKIAPHFGSSIAIGISLYVFRILMICMLGKNISGDFFAAFAIGGILGSLFVSAFGPTIAFNEKKRGDSTLPKLLVLMLWFFFSLGLLIITCTFFIPTLFNWPGKELYYWQAIGFSMIGGVIMVNAQLLRFRMLIHHEDHDLFGPDLLMNMLVIIAIPLAYYSFGLVAVASISMLGAMLSFAFYKSSEYKEIMTKKESQHKIKYSLILIVCFILLPIFIKLDTGLYITKDIFLGSNGSLMSTPIPLSIFVVYVGILIIGAYRKARLSIGLLFFSYILMIFSTLIILPSHVSIEKSKIILLIECLLPMGGLLLGEMIKAKDLNVTHWVEKIFITVLVAIVPLQLTATWLHGNFYLSNYLFLFSIYQHLEYVPIIFVSAYLLSLFSLWENKEYKIILFVLGPLMGIYSAASLSFVAISFLILGVLIFALVRWRLALEKTPSYFLLALVASCFCYLAVNSSQALIIDNLEQKMVTTLSAWAFYGAEINASLKTLFFGHAILIDKLLFPSAHNYFLDIAYNFGMVSILPIFLLMTHTIRITFIAKRFIMTNLSLFGALFVLFFLLIIDNSTQVSLRQPYSAIFIFFLWGLLISRLNEINTLQ